MQARKSIGHMMVIISCMALAGCDSMMHTSSDVREIDRRKAELETKKSEVEYADRLCTSTPMVGMSAGFNLTLELKRSELDSAKASIGLDSYNRLSQQLAGYSVEWEALNGQVTAACRQNAICLYRSSDSGPCYNSDTKYQNKIKEGNALVVKIKELSIQK